MQDAVTEIDAAPWPDGAECIARCQGSECGKERAHVILRLNLPGKPRLCDQCHAVAVNFLRRHNA